MRLVVALLALSVCVLLPWCGGAVEEVEQLDSVMESGDLAAGKATPQCSLAKCTNVLRKAGSSFVKQLDKLQKEKKTLASQKKESQLGEKGLARLHEAAEEAGGKISAELMRVIQEVVTEEVRKKKGCPKGKTSTPSFAKKIGGKKEAKTDGCTSREGGTWLRDMIASPHDKHMWLQVFKGLTTVANFVGGVMCKSSIKMRKEGLTNGCCKKIMKLNYSVPKHGKYKKRWTLFQYGKRGDPLPVKTYIQKNLNNPGECKNQKFLSSYKEEDWYELGDSLAEGWGRRRKSSGRRRKGGFFSSMANKAKSAFNKVKNKVKSVAKKVGGGMKSMILNKVLGLLPKKIKFLKPAILKGLPTAVGGEGNIGAALNMVLHGPLAQQMMTFVRENAWHPLINKLLPLARMDCLCATMLGIALTPDYKAEVETYGWHRWADIRDLTVSGKPMREQNVSPTFDLRLENSKERFERYSKKPIDFKCGKECTGWVKGKQANSANFNPGGIQPPTSDSLRKDFGPMTFYIKRYKAGDASKKAVCKMSISIDFLLCVNKKNMKKFPAVNLQKEVMCGGDLVRRPVKTSLVSGHGSVHSCEGWYTIVDGFLRGVVGGASSVQTARLVTCKCFEKRPECGALIKRKPKKEEKKEEMGEAVGVGRRAGGGASLGSSSNFMLSAGSNTAGNDEALL